MSMRRTALAMSLVLVCCLPSFQADAAWVLPGGEGAQIIRVTNLNASGPGSLREAIQAKGPRVVVFEVGGIIDLKKDSLSLSEPFITIAGQTAPSPGITIIRGGMGIATHDVLVQHIRVRPGDAGEPKKSGWEPDGITTRAANQVVIDHCSLSWAVDENLSASGPRYEGPDKTSRNVTFSHCIVAEGLNDSSHSKGPHSKGSLIHDYCTNITIIGNLYAHNVERNPYYKAFTTGAVVNNVIYNPGQRAIQVDWPASEWEGQAVVPQNARISVVGNVLIHGTDTPANLALVSRKGDVYLENNMALNREGRPAPITSGSIRILSEKPMWPADLKPLPASKVVDHVSAHAGARPKDRDSVDRRIIRDLQERKGRIIDSQDDVGGYPQSEMTRHDLVVPDRDVQAWLAKLASDLE